MRHKTTKKKHGIVKEFMKTNHAVPFSSRTKVSFRSCPYSSVSYGSYKDGMAHGLTVTIFELKVYCDLYQNGYLKAQMIFDRNFVHKYK